MRPKALWIEDSARLELKNLCGPVYFHGECDLTLAEDITTAVNLILAEQFDALVVDVRLPPGRDPNWESLYERWGSDQVSAQLGLKLLHWLLRGDREIYPADPPDWVRPEQIGVFTVEPYPEIEKHLQYFEITVYQEKNADIPDTVLHDLIVKLLGR